MRLDLRIFGGECRMSPRSKLTWIGSPERFLSETLLDVVREAVTRNEER